MLTYSFIELIDELLLYFLYDNVSQEIFMLICSLCYYLSATNINDAVLRAVSMLEKERRHKNLPERSADMVILLTDGMPNAGELEDHNISFSKVREVTICGLSAAS